MTSEFHVYIRALLPKRSQFYLFKYSRNWRHVEYRPLWVPGTSDEDIQSGIYLWYRKNFMLQLVQSRMYLSYLGFLVCDKTPWPKVTWERVYSSVYFYIIVHLRKSGLELKGGTWSEELIQRREWSAAYWLLSLLFSAIEDHLPRGSRIHWAGPSVSAISQSVPAG